MKQFNRIVLNIPHSTNNMAGMAGWKKNNIFIEDIKKWTDWYTDIIFGTNEENIIPIVFPYSRFYIDAERLIDDEMEKIGQGIIYTEFNDNVRTISNEEKEKLMIIYNNHISCIKKQLTEKSLLIDCHSFPSELSDNSICIGFNEDWSKPSEEIISNIVKIFEKMGYSVGINTPYSNSLSPKCNFTYKSLMIEVNKRCYMDERTLSLNPNFYNICGAISNVYNYILSL